jgi:hypothetical protein
VQGDPEPVTGAAAPVLNLASRPSKRSSKSLASLAAATVALCGNARAPSGIPAQPFPLFSLF